MVQIVIVEKTGNCKSLNIKSFNREELYKKCNYKKPDGFIELAIWKDIKINGIKYNVHLHGKNTGKANSENKYDFPPPIDNELLFGSCTLVNYDNNDEVLDLTVEEWEKIYEKLFGGFEDLATTCKEDEEEEDELDNIPDEMKTEEGYMKDGFIVDNEEVECDTISSEDEYDDLDSELSEDHYTYSDEN
jgi:hypothetical protein